MSKRMTAWDRLLDLIDVTKASDVHNISPSTAIAAAIRESVVNAPSLRNCLYPGCLREFDMTARMNGREPERPSWSGDGWHQATRGVSHGSICPDHVAIVTEHLARPVGLPNGRWMVACACEWTSRPQTYGGLLRPLWEEHVLTVTGELQAPSTPGTDFERIPLADHTEATLTELYDALDDTEYDRLETRDAAQAMYRSWDWHRTALGGVTSALNAIRNHMRVSSTDWAAGRTDAYLWAILIGWDDEALQEVAAKHRWNEHRIAYIRQMRGYLAPITDPQKETAG